jgi:hypothetical protein
LTPPVRYEDGVAEREKQARVILGSAEAAIAGKFVEAANIYAGHPEVLQLRAMNIIYETTKKRGATILMPSSMVASMNPYGNTLAVALAGNEVLKPKWCAQDSRATATCSRGLTVTTFALKGEGWMQHAGSTSAFRH